MGDNAYYRQVYEKLFRDSYARLCIYAARITHQEDEAEEIVQQVFVRLWENRRKIDWTYDLSAYLFRSVRNAAFNYIRNECVRFCFYDFLFREQIDLGGENRTEDHEFLLQHLEELISLMPKQMHDIFLLNRFYGKTVQEIAEQLKISVRTVENQIYRAMKYLRERLTSSSDRLLLLFLMDSCVKTEN